MASCRKSQRLALRSSHDEPTTTTTNEAEIATLATNQEDNNNNNNNNEKSDSNKNDSGDSSVEVTKNKATNHDKGDNNLTKIDAPSTFESTSSPPPKAKKRKIDQDAKQASDDPTIIIPKEQDFLFVPAGGHWQSIRNLSYWNADRLRHLGVSYTWFSTHEEKQAFVQSQIIQVVRQRGGRFLRAHKKSVHDLSCTWTVLHVDDDDGDMNRTIARELKRILRQMQSRSVHKEQVNRQMVQQLQQNVTTLQHHVNAIQGTLLLSPPSEKAGTTVSYGQARQANNIIKRMTQDAIQCRAKLNDPNVTINDNKNNNNSKSKTMGAAGVVEVPPGTMGPWRKTNQHVRDDDSTLSDGALFPHRE